MKGFLGGAATGLVLSALTLGTVSVLSEAPAGNTPPAAPLQDAPQVAAPAAPEVEPANGPGQGQGPSLAPPPEAGAPQVTSLGGGDALNADTAEPVAPDATALDGGLEAPGAADAPGVAMAEETPVLPNPLAVPPATPEGETDVVLSTEPAPLPAPVIVEDGEEPAATETGQDLLVVDLGERDDAAVIVDVAPEAAPQAVPEAAPDVTAEPAPAPDATLETAEAPVPETPSAAATDVQTAPETDALETDAPETAAPGDGPAPRIALQGSDATLPGAGTPGITIRRPGVDPEPDPEAFDMGEPLGALDLYAAVTPEPAPLPRMSVILLDEGGMPQPEAVLSGLPFPVTIALDPASEGAAEKLAAYRAGGREVVLVARVPQNAAPQDVNVTFEALFSDYRETVAVLDLGDGGYQGSAEVTEQAMFKLAEDGRGFVTASTGLNTALREADRAGVPAATIYRDLDSEGQDARTIRRFIDQAAFRARQESGVVLVGRMRPDTLSALILWAATDRAEQVAVVPVSRVLLGN